MEIWGPIPLEEVLFHTKNSTSGKVQQHTFCIKIVNQKSLIFDFLSCEESIFPKRWKIRRGSHLKGHNWCIIALRKLCINVYVYRLYTHQAHHLPFRQAGQAPEPEALCPMTLDPWFWREKVSPIVRHPKTTGLCVQFNPLRHFVLGSPNQVFDNHQFWTKIHGPHTNRLDWPNKRSCQTNSRMHKVQRHLV